LPKLPAIYGQNIPSVLGQQNVALTINHQIDNGQNMEKLIKALIEDHLVQLSHYIQMNQMTRTVLIDHTSMKADGYQVIIH